MESAIARTHMYTRHCARGGLLCNRPRLLLWRGPPVFCGHARPVLSVCTLASSSVLAWLHARRGDNFRLSTRNFHRSRLVLSRESSLLLADEDVHDDEDGDERGRLAVTKPPQLSLIRRKPMGAWCWLYLALYAGFSCCPLLCALREKSVVFAYALAIVGVRVLHVDAADESWLFSWLRWQIGHTSPWAECISVASSVCDERCYFSREDAACSRLYRCNRLERMQPSSLRACAERKIKAGFKCNLAPLIK